MRSVVVAPLGSGHQRFELSSPQETRRPVSQTPQSADGVPRQLAPLKRHGGRPRKELAAHDQAVCSPASRPRAVQVRPSGRQFVERASSDCPPPEGRSLMSAEAVL